MANAEAIRVSHRGLQMKRIERRSINTSSLSDRLDNGKAGRDYIAMLSERLNDCLPHATWDRGKSPRALIVMEVGPWRN